MSSIAQPAAVLSGYAGLDHGYDELIGHAGAVRSHCGPFADGIDALGLDEFTQRWREAQQLIRENGVTYNVYGDPRGMDRPWELDPIPLLIAPSDAVRLEAGLVPRAIL